ncbi:hypothetical protein [Tenacibaculum phage Larrie]|nr:hypothetical protein [Tenacibaculum phage Larrie]
MSTVSIYVSENKSIIFSDSQSSDGVTKRTLKTPKCRKFKLNKNEDILVGATGSFNYINMIRFIEYDSIFRMWSNIDDFVYSGLREEVESTVKDLNIESGNMILCVRGRIFVIESNFQVLEMSKNFHAIGSGGNFAVAAMEAFTSKNCVWTCQEVLDIVSDIDVRTNNKLITESTAIFKK